MKTIAVVVAAWRAERWIGDCIKSIRAQRGVESWRVEIRVAVDGCEATSAELLRLGVPHWWSPVNVGPYILRNTLIGKGRAAAYATFDADDMMEPLYLEHALRLARPCGIAGTGRMTINERGQVTSRRSRYGHGVSVFMHDAWMRLGGFRSWRVAADADMIARAKALGIRVRATSRPLYRRRKHANGLTVMPETGMGSDLREAVKAESARLLEAGDLVVIPETIPLEWRRP